MYLQQIQNATIFLYYGGKTFLIDPILAPKGSWPPRTIKAMTDWKYFKLTFKADILFQFYWNKISASIISTCYPNGSPGFSVPIYQKIIFLILVFHKFCWNLYTFFHFLLLKLFFIHIFNTIIAILIKRNIISKLTGSHSLIISPRTTIPARLDKKHNFEISSHCFL